MTKILAMMMMNISMAAVEARPFIWRGLMLIMPLTMKLIIDNDNDENDPLQGDSGGPLTVADSTSGAHTLVGAVGWGVGCARVG